MKKSIKTTLIIIALALVACVALLVWLGSRPEDSAETIAESVVRSAQGPGFEVRVIVPRMGRPLGGILPDWLMKKLDGTPSELRFDHASPGAKFVSAGPDRVEVTADGWDLLIETDGEGRVTPGTRLVFPLALGGKRLKLRCRPGDRGKGDLRTTTRAGSGELVGAFLVELATCENAESGKVMNWPPAALIVSGSFVSPATPRH